MGTMNAIDLTRTIARVAASYMASRKQPADSATVIIGNITEGFKSINDESPPPIMQKVKRSYRKRAFKIPEPTIVGVEDTPVEQPTMQEPIISAGTI